MIDTDEKHWIDKKQSTQAALQKLTKELNDMAASYNTKTGTISKK